MQQNGKATGANRHAVITFLDLFGGIGAMRLGFEEACRESGIEPLCVGFSEIDGPATNVYLRHFPGTPVLGDVKTLASAGRIPECDVILAGFPCPSYSSAGRRLGFADERGKLFFALARIIGKSKPKAFLCENVKGLASHNRGRTLAAILDILRNQLGFAVHHAILNSRDFGVPQNRPRVYIAGFRDGGGYFRFPHPTNSTKRLKDILEAQPVSARHYLSERRLECLRAHKARHEARGNGFGYSVIDPDNTVAGTLLSSNWGQEKNIISDGRLNELPAPHGRKSPVNHEHIRRLTAIEWERLQGLPDGFTEGQADGSRYKQLGNAVTVPVVRAISRNLLESLGQAGLKASPSILILDSAGAGNPVSIPLTSVEGCAGCGGLSAGLERDGTIKVRVACEFDPAAAETYRLNHPGTLVVEKDLAEETTRREIVAALGGRRCDLLVAGLPCQAYSLSGWRDPNDPRGSLFEHFIDLIVRLSPRVVVIENVRGILSMKRPDGTPVMDAIARAFRGLGYAVGHHLVNSADFGDPQSRQRVVIFGWRQGSMPRFEKTHDEHGRGGLPQWRTVRDAIADLEDAPEDPDSWHVFTRSSPEYVERIRRTPIGQSVNAAYKEARYRNPPDQPAITVKENHGGVIVHYRRDRLVTPRSAAWTRRVSARRRRSCRWAKAWRSGSAARAAASSSESAVSLRAAARARRWVGVGFMSGDAAGVGPAARGVAL